MRRTSGAMWFWLENIPKEILFTGPKFHLNSSSSFGVIKTFCSGDLSVGSKGSEIVRNLNHIKSLYFVRISVLLICVFCNLHSILWMRETVFYFPYFQFKRCHALHYLGINIWFIRIKFKTIEIIQCLLAKAP